MPAPFEPNLPRIDVPLRQLDVAAPLGGRASAPAIHPSLGQVWVTVGSWDTEIPPSPPRVIHAKTVTFAEEMGRVRAWAPTHPRLAPLVAWGGRPPSRPWVAFSTGPGRSLWHLRRAGFRLRPHHAAGLVAQAAEGWLALVEAGQRPHGSPTQPWLAADSAAVRVVEWVLPPVSEGIQSGATKEWIAFGVGDDLATPSGFGWAVAVLAWLAQGGDVEALSAAEISFRDWLQPTALPEVDPALAVLMEVARSVDPPAPAELVERLWGIADSGPAPDRWPDVVVPV